MRPAPLIASGGLLLLACSCYGPAYQQPYGYPAYPGQVQPGTPYYPGGGPSLGTPTFDSSRAPTNGGSFSSPSTSGSERPVPNYGDPSSSSGSSPYFPSGGSSGSSGAANGAAASPEVEPLGFNFSEPATPVPSTNSARPATPAAQPSNANPFFDLNVDDGDFQEPVNGQLR